MVDELLLGSMVVAPTGQTGCVTGFYLPGPQAPPVVKSHWQVAPDDQDEAHWFQETSYCLARAGPGFVRVIRPAGPIYWRLDSLKVIPENNEAIVLDEDDG